MNTRDQIYETNDGSLTLFNQDISECYHSKGGAKWESEHLYIKSSGIEAFFENHNTAVSSVLDVGLGLGYNACTTIEAWMKSSGKKDLYLTSLEYNETLIESLATNSGRWQKGWCETWQTWCSALTPAPGGKSATLRHPVSGKHIFWNLYSGNAKDVIETISTKPWTHIWQDPFSPEKNPELWNPEWFSILKKKSGADCRLMTYSVARQVKDALSLGGWAWKKIPASGPKRHWLAANPAES